MGREETESNGHRREIETMELLYTMISLKMEVQSYKDDNLLCPQQLPFHFTYSSTTHKGKLRGPPLK